MPVTVLVVDDEPDLELLIRQKFRQKISASEYEFLFAGNGVQALEQLDAHPEIELVLTDLNMPEMDGFALLGELAGLDRVLKSVVISAYGDLDNVRVAMNRGAFDFITKPINFEDLEITIAKTLEEVRRLREGLEATQSLAAMRQEIEVAARIQQAILPKQVPAFPSHPEIDLFATMLPAHQVGGDFYDFFLIDEQRAGFVIGDVAGKGVPASLLMAVSRSLLKATALTGKKPGQCLTHVNRLLCADDMSDVFVTLFYSVLDLGSGALAYSNAGHNLPFHMVPGATPEPIENQGGLVLGVEQDTEYHSRTLHLKPGSVLFLYTDGVTEAMNSEKELYGEERLLQQLQADGESSMQALTEHIVEGVREFVQDHPQHDDITMLSVRWQGPPR